MEGLASGTMRRRKFGGKRQNEEINLVENGKMKKKEHPNSADIPLLPCAFRVCTELSHQGISVCR